MSFTYQFLKHSSTYTLEAVASVIRTEIQVTNLAHLVFHNQDVFASCSNDDIALDTMVMKPFSLRIYRCSTYTTSNKYNSLFLNFFKIICYQLRRTSQRSHKVCDGIASFELQQFVSRYTNRLEYDGNRSCFSVIVTDGKRNTLSILVHSENDELSRFAGFCYSRSENNLLVDICRELLCL